MSNYMKWIEKLMKRKTNFSKMLLTRQAFNQTNKHTISVMGTQRIRCAQCAHTTDDCTLGTK